MKRLRLQQNEQGVVSFMVIIIMMLVISLIVIGFSEVTQRNARETLDQELSDQATYAAESGINATAAAIKGGKIQQQTGCGSSLSAYPPANLTNGGDVAYTCVSVDPYPKDLEFNGVNTATPTIARIQSYDTTSFKQLEFTWNLEQPGYTPGTSCRGAGQGIANSEAAYPPNDTTNWPCGLAVLRVDLVRDVDGILGQGGNNQVAKLSSGMATLFLSPLGPTPTAVPNSSNISFGGTANAYQMSANCSNGVCSAYVNLPTANGNNYYVRINSIYRNPQLVTISGTTTSGPARFMNNQAIIDVTGRAQDQLKRVQVRMPLTDTLASDQIPLNALGSKAEICKRFVTLPGDDPSSPIDDCSAP